ncbi:MAG: hypothetical protein DRP09_14435 [Candidatus Thorarchaeota archaeon]|nr:MAG: hypothetical protein DRP09_14435 [Candidatus Thorarchaeota archaeon]
MINVFVGDTVDVVLDVGCDVSGTSVQKIKYKKPSGESGAWDATVLGDNPTKIKADNVVFDRAGQWEIQAYVESMTLKSHGKIVRLLVKVPL